MLKMALSMLLALLFLLPASAVGEDMEPQRLTNAQGFVYILVDDGSAEIVGYTGKALKLVIPEKLDGHRVTAIGERAFAGTKITEVTVAKSIKRIDISAFEFCRAMTTARLPEGLEFMNSGVFRYCEKLTTVNLPDTLKLIDDRVFESCSALSKVKLSSKHPLLELVDGVLFTRDTRRLLWYPVPRKEQAYSIPEGTLSIGSMAFSITQVTAVTIPDSVEQIAPYAFNHCTRLKSINIPAKVTELRAVFTGCQNLTDILVSPNNPVFYDLDGVLFQREEQKLALYPAGRKDEHYEIPEGTLIIGAESISSRALTEIVIPASVKTIEFSAFYGTRLTSVVIPEGVEVLGPSAFQHCHQLTEVRLPRSLVKVNSNPFLFCDRLSTVMVDEDHPALAIMNGALVCLENMRLVWYPETGEEVDYTIPPGVRAIDAYAFRDCGYLTGITLPEGLESIDAYVFTGCTNLNRIVLPASLTEIDKTAFQMKSDSRELIPATYVVVPGSYAENFCQSYGLRIEYAR